MRRRRDEVSEGPRSTAWTKWRGSEVGGSDDPEGSGSGDAGDGGENSFWAWLDFGAWLGTGVKRLGRQKSLEAGGRE